MHGADTKAVVADVSMRGDLRGATLSTAREASRKCARVLLPGQRRSGATSLNLLVWS